ncbi:MAG TPA: Fe(3+) ABC transporter substrate-binding protein [Alphaproteobacteria bacterium]|nr:Fe(3+) ABC transporter substrate-binding protein [Alphaproteobacteria bacterium]
MSILHRGAATAIGLFVAGAAFAAAAQEEVNVYSARHYDTDLQLYDRFTEETGIEVNLIEAESDELIQRIVTEGENSPADILMTVDAGRLWRAVDAGVFQPTDSEVLESRIPSSLRHPDGLWFGLSKRARVILYNKETGAPEGLDTYEDLADPAYDDMLCIRSSSNIYNQSLMGSIIAAHGAEEAEEWAKGVVENMAREPEGGDTDQINAVAAGLCDIAVANTYYLARLVASDDPEDRAIGEKIGVIFPNQDDRGTHVNISGAGVVATAPNRENAVRFLEYLTSDEAQKIFAEGNNEYPVVEGVEMSPVIAGWGPFKQDELNAAVFGENNPQALMIMDRAGWQ